MIIFYMFCFLTVVSAIFTVITQQLVQAMFMFFLTLFCLAGLYVFALADFVALSHILVYIGGVLVLMVFGFMLSDKTVLNAIPQVINPSDKKQRVVITLLSILFFILMLTLWRSVDISSITWLNYAVNEESHSIKNIGIALMSEYLIPFELTSILLLMALLGVAYLSRKESTDA